MNNTIYRRIIKHFNGVSGLARALGISRQAVYLWQGNIPRGRALEIERMTGGKFNADKIRPNRAA